MIKYLKQNQDQNISELEVLKSKSYSLVVKSGDEIIFTSKSSGLFPLIEAVNKKLLKNSIVIDKTIGLAAAKICYWSGVKKIVSLVASKAAVNFLMKDNCEIHYGVLVEKIKNKNGEECRMEQMARTVCNLKDFLSRFEKFNDAILEKAPGDGVFPDNYYTTTNLETEIKINGRWRKVKRIEMDLGIKVDREKNIAICITGNDVKRGDLIVVGDHGIRIEKNQLKDKREEFKFMGNDISTERQKKTMVRLVARRMWEIKMRGGRILFVVGPAVIHTGAGDYLESLIKKGYVDCLFSGNGFAVHDLERNIFGTALGVNVKTGEQSEEGHHHHLWAINAIRKYKSIERAVKFKVITGGVMYQLVKQRIPFVLAGSIRDDGPLPETISDTIEAQQAMRRQVWKGFDLAIMCATTLHSVATGNILPANVQKVIVDANPSSVIKLIDRGTTGSLGIITDVEYFLGELVDNLHGTKLKKHFRQKSKKVSKKCIYYGKKVHGRWIFA